MRRVVVHFGFHKTGTSTTEHMLLSNAGLLRPYCLVLGHPQLGDAPERAKIYSRQRTSANLTGLEDAWQTCLNSLQVGADQAVIISCEDLSGRIPGHPGVNDYGAVPALVEAMRKGLQRRFGPQCDAVFVASVRNSEAWLKSLWWQNLKARRITEDREEFAHRFASISDLQHQARRLEQAAAPFPMRTVALEDSSAHAQGPAGPLLDLIDLPEDMRDQLQPQKPLKVSLPPEAQALFLEMNRSDLSDAELKQVKADALLVLKTNG